MMQSRRMTTDINNDLRLNDEDEYVRDQIYTRLRLIESNNKEIHSILKEHYSRGFQSTQLGWFNSSNSNNCRIAYYDEQYKRRETIKEIIGVFVSTFIFLAIAATFMQR